MNINFLKIRTFFFFLISILSLMELIQIVYTFFFLNIVLESAIINDKTDTVSTMVAIRKIYLSIDESLTQSSFNAIFYFARNSGVKSWEHQFSSNHLRFNAFSLFACRAIRVYRFRKFYTLIYSFKFLKNLIVK